ncbi:50S ribosome-binding GTPase [Pelistega sp. NLN82]|uniref:50S ribosome-binding GTPase n=1 Tax=Pelistega ratti TaxID=2652177 RepID=A0A6L9Y7E2_9BURK|nr:dynamin family protein [Pelistega ratti]NEN76309.1 50S ribosome-binding GTPase [Pelistega ratti]
MKEIYISHNPFIVQTVFKFDGNEPNANALAEFRKNRFQQWVERLFPELSAYCNGLKTFNVHFRGLESDYLDLVEAAEKARAEGMQIELSFTEEENANHRLTKIQALVEDAKNHRLFKEKLNTNSKFIDDLEASINKDFDIYVAATMSSGKSTLINAMLGTDLLPAANEATTATIARIYDTNLPVGQFRGQRFNFNNELVDPEQDITLDTLKDWNAKPDTLLIEIQGNITGVAKREDVRLVLSDTPGPNNSQTDEHSKTTMRQMKDTKKNPIILYILNATQPGINDDKNTLRMISDIIRSGGKQSEDRFIFVVNKMDMFDPEKGENIQNALNNLRSYLESNGITNPHIYPVSANLTRLLRKRALKPDSLSRSERHALTAMEDIFNEEESMNLEQYMPLTNTVKKKLDQGNYSAVERRSGLPAVEKLIDTYIEKYNLPERVFRAQRVLENVLMECSNEKELISSLAENENELKELHEAIEKLKIIKNSSANTESYIQEIRKKGIGLPKDTITSLKEQENKVQVINRNFAEHFEGEVELAKAENLLEQLRSTINHHYQDITTSYDSIMEAMDDLMKTQLEHEYKQRVKAIFDNVKDFNMPQLEKLQLQIEQALVIKELDSKEIKDEVKTRTKIEKEKRKLSNFFGLFGLKTIKSEVPYKTGKQLVNLNQVWEERGQEIIMQFNTLTNHATEEIKKRQKAQVEQYLEFMAAEFDPRFNAILKELEGKITNQDRLEQEVKQAKIDLEEIAQFKARIHEVTLYKGE